MYTRWAARANATATGTPVQEFVRTHHGTVTLVPHDTRIVVANHNRQLHVQITSGFEPWDSNTDMDRRYHRGRVPMYAANMIAIPQHQEGFSVMRSLVTEELPDKVRKLFYTQMSSPPKGWQRARAWMQDATYLQTLLREHRQALGKQQNHPIQQLAQAAAIWEEAIDDFLKHQAAKRGTGASRQAVPPHMRIKWCSQEHSTPQTRHRVCLRLATFGWWRSSSQHQTNYMKLAKSVRT